MKLRRDGLAIWIGYPELPPRAMVSACIELDVFDRSTAAILLSKHPAHWCAHVTVREVALPNKCAEARRCG